MSRWLVGSSSTMQGVFWAIALARTILCCSPPERVKKLLSANSYMSTFFRASMAISLSSALSNSMDFLCGERPIRTTSMTLKSNGEYVCCGTTDVLRALS